MLYELKILTRGSSCFGEHPLCCKSFIRTKLDADERAWSELVLHCLLGGRGETGGCQLRRWDLHVLELRSRLGRSSWYRRISFWSIFHRLFSGWDKTGRMAGQVLSLQAQIVFMPLTALQLARDIASSVNC